MATVHSLLRSAIHGKTLTPNSTSEISVGMWQTAQLPWSFHAIGDWPFPATRRAWENGVVGGNSIVQTNGMSAMNALLTAIVTWLAANFPLPANYQLPKVEMLPSTQIAHIRYGNVPPSRRGRIVAIYVDRRRTIYLSSNWSAKSAAEISILIHEMVHHLQNVAQIKYECPAAREKLAYEAQARWLAFFGRDLHKEFGVDDMTLKLRTTCMRH